MGYYVCNVSEVVFGVLFLEMSSKRDGTGPSRLSDSSSSSESSDSDSSGSSSDSSDSDEMS